MPDTQNAFILPAPVSPQAKQAPQSKPSYTNLNKAHKAGKKYDAIKGGGDNNELASFTSMLNQFTEQPEQTVKQDSSNAAVSSEQEPGHEGNSAPILGGGVKLMLSKPLLELMASLKDRLKGKDAAALTEEAAAILNELGGKVPESDMKAVEAMLTELRETGVSTEIALPENGEAVNANQKVQAPVKPESDAQPLRPEDLLLHQGKPADAQDDEAAIEGAEPQETESTQSGAEQLKNAPVTSQAALPEGQAEAGLKEEEPQPLAVSKFHAYLKPDVQKTPEPQQEAAAETAAAEGGKNPEGKTEKSASADAVVTNSNSETKPREELSDGLGGGREERQQPDRRDDLPRSAARQAVETDKPEQDGGAKVKTNFTENRPAFEQFFNAATARRDAPAASPAPTLELTGGLTQGGALNESLNNAVRFIRANGEHRASVIVDPPALGRVSVELTSTTNGLEASVKVSSEQIRHLIQDHLTQLKLSLEQQGVQLTHFSVDVQQDDRRENREQGGRNSRRRSGGAHEEEDAMDGEALFKVDLNQGLLSWVA